MTKKKYSRYISSDSNDFKSCHNERGVVISISNLQTFIADESLMIFGNTKYNICSGFPKKYHINDTSFLVA
jgi:hypothetical protein